MLPGPERAAGYQQGILASERGQTIETTAIADADNTEAPTGLPAKNLAATATAGTGNTALEDAMAHTEPFLPGFDAKFASTFEKHLTKLQEAEVNFALDASKKVLEEVQWKALEKSIADAMTLAEKDQVKAIYDKQMENKDWQKVSEKMKQSYEQIDWPALNADLSKAVAEIRLDSMQHVYQRAISELSSLKAELEKNGQKSIPDTDISDKTLLKKLDELKKASDALRAIRTRKVIEL